MKPAKNLKASVLAVLKAHRKLDAFTTPGEGFHVAVQSPGYMDLVIERHGDRVTISHYFQQNGDMVADPDVEFYIAGDFEWYPVAMQTQWGYHVCLEFEAGKMTRQNPTTAKDILAFTNVWARNIKEQGFSTGTLRK
ncbi:MAG: hypothetical protein U1F43_26290 [Myxococcota bacterium]